MLSPRERTFLSLYALSGPEDKKATIAAYREAYDLAEDKATDFAVGRKATRVLGKLEAKNFVRAEQARAEQARVRGVAKAQAEIFNEAVALVKLRQVAIERATDELAVTTGRDFASVLDASNKLLGKIGPVAAMPDVKDVLAEEERIEQLLAQKNAASEVQPPQPATVAVPTLGDRPVGKA